jgi:chromosome partitioning protein
MIRETPLGADLIPASPYMNPLLADAPKTFLRECLGACRQSAHDGRTSAHDVVLVDTPPYIGPAFWAALFASDGVVIPVQLEGLSIEGLNSFLEALQTAREQGNADLSVTGVFANQVDVRRSTAESGWALLQRQYGDIAFQARLRQRAAIADAGTAKAPLLENTGPHVREAFSSLTDEFIDRI